MKKRIFSVLIAFLMCVSSISNFSVTVDVYANAELPVVEYLNRGIVSARNGTGTTGRFVSWRMLASDAPDTVFRLYRDGTLIHTTTPTGATGFFDSAGTDTSNYRVDAVVNGTVVDSQGHGRDRGAVIRANGFQNNQQGGAFFTIPLTAPPRGQHGGNYFPNDIAVGDIDGDGQYELFLKWEPDNARDGAQDGITDNTFIELIRLNGERIWRIDLGPNIRSGAHYTQMMVADFQLNGTAQLVVRTSDGTIDGRGTRIGTNAVHRNSAGRVNTGPEFLTLFCGKTGEALDTIPYVPERGNVEEWGFGRPGQNRANRFLGAVAYLDGVRPHAIPIRGYYTRIAATAYRVENNKLVEVWRFDTGRNNSSHPLFGQGNHQVMPAAVHAEHNRQSLFLGPAALRYDGTQLWSSGRGHGDALHVGNFIPGRARGNDIQAFSCFETSPYGISLFHGRTGQELFRQTASGDTGRAMGGNFFAGHPGSEFWAFQGTLNDSGQHLGNGPNSRSFAIWWDGDRERELLDTTGSGNSWMRIEKLVNTDGGLSRIFTAHATSINGTKANPNLSADIFGDWREELIMRNGNEELVVFTTRIPTDYRITTLMHDPQYRMQVGGQNICYNQPPHTSFYMGSDAPLPPRPNVTVQGESPEPPVFGISLSQQETLTFPSADVGYGEQEWFPIIVSNTGNQPTGALEITAPAGFSVQGRTGLASGIAVGATRTFDVRPSRNSSPGVYSGEVTVSGENGIVARFNVSFTVNAPLPDCEDCEKTPCICHICEICEEYPCICPVPLPSGRLISELQRFDTANIDSWSIQDVLHVGDTVYGDRANVFTAIPEKLLGAERLQTAANTRVFQSDTVEFIANEDIFVYIGLDARRNVSDLTWLNGWQNVNQTVRATDQINPEGDGITYNLFRMPLAEGQSMRLGSNGPAGSVIMYTVFFLSDDGIPNCTECGEYSCICVPEVTFNFGYDVFVSTDTALNIVISGESVGVLPRATESMFYRNGYRFRGWYENLDDETTRWEDNDEINGKINLYAKWVQTPSGFILGDSNRDGRITSADATETAKYLLAYNPNICDLAADLNGNGLVDVGDITLLARWLVGINVRHLLAH